MDKLLEIEDWFRRKLTDQYASRVLVAQIRREGREESRSFWVLILLDPLCFDNVKETERVALMSMSLTFCNLLFLYNMN